jgi:hypothetical protein
MSLNVFEIGLQNTSLEQKRVLATGDTSIISEFNLKTSEGELVRFSFAGEKSLSESMSQTQTQEHSTSQKFSSVARATASYSLAVEGGLNSEELAAINKLAQEITPLARDFLASGKLNLENPFNILGDDLGTLVQLELLLERTVVTTFETKSVKQFPEETDKGTNVKDLPSQLPELETDGVRDYPALVQATIDAVFKSEAECVPVQDSTPRSLSDLLAFIRDRFNEYFTLPTRLSGLTIEPTPASDGEVDVQTPALLVGSEPSPS